MRIAEPGPGQVIEDWAIGIYTRRLSEGLLLSHVVERDLICHRHRHRGVQAVVVR